MKMTSNDNDYDDNDNADDVVLMWKAYLPVLSQLGPTPTHNLQYP